LQQDRQCHQTVYGNQSCTLQNNCACAGCLCLADSCLCETSSWLIAVTQCIGEQCGASAVSDAAGIASSACAGNGYPLVVSEQSIIAEGLAAIPSTTAATTTASKTQAAGTSPQNTQSSTTPVTSPASQSNSTGGTVSSSGSHKGLSTAIIAVIAVLATLLASLVVGGLLYRRYKRKQARRDINQILDPRDDDGRSNIGNPGYQKAVVTDTSGLRSASIDGWVRGVGDAIELHDRPSVPQSVSEISGATLNAASQSSGRT